MSGVKGKSGRKSKAWHAAKAAAEALAAGRPAVEVANAAVKASKVTKRPVTKEVAEANEAEVEAASATLDVGDGVTDSREFLELVIADPRVPITVRVRAAATLAQYQHVRSRDGGKKETAQERAHAVVKGEARAEDPRPHKYAPAAPPHGLGLIRGGKVA